MKKVTRQVENKSQLLQAVEAAQISTSPTTIKLGDSFTVNVLPFPLYDCRNAFEANKYCTDVQYRNKQFGRIKRRIRRQPASLFKS